MPRIDRTNIKSTRGNDSTTSYAMTYSEIAEVEGISRERVRQIIEQALAKLRVALADRGLKADDCLGGMG